MLNKLKKLLLSGEGFGNFFIQLPNDPKDQGQGFSTLPPNFL